jgi:hypothetical protein
MQMGIIYRRRKIIPSSHNLIVTDILYKVMSILACKGDESVDDAHIINQGLTTSESIL